MTLNVTVPNAKLGDISSDMSGRRGRVSGMESAGGDMQTVIAEVPLSEVTTYARSLSSITGGQGSFTMEFSHYEAVPGNVQKQIIDKAGVTHEEEEVKSNVDRARSCCGRQRRFDVVGGNWGGVGRGRPG